MIFFENTMDNPVKKTDENYIEHTKSIRGLRHDFFILDDFSEWDKRRENKFDFEAYANFPKWWKKYWEKKK